MHCSHTMCIPVLQNLQAGRVQKCSRSDAAACHGQSPSDKSSRCQQAASRSSRALPADLDYMNITTLSMESREKLTKVCVRPVQSAVYIATFL